MVAGTAAKAQVVRNRQNTVIEFKQMLGRNFEELVHHTKRWPFKLVEKDGQPAVEVEYKDQTVLFTPEEITGFMIKRMKETAESFLGVAIHEAVLTVPAHFTPKQRQAIRDAAAKADLKVLRLINEPTATALAFNAGQAIDKDQIIVVVDIGASLNVTVLASYGGIYQIIKHHHEPGVGGREFDQKLVGHFSTEFKRKSKLDISDNPKSLTKLGLAAEMTKRSLSQSPQSPISVESLHEGEDLRSSINRTLFDVLIGPVVAKVIAVIEKTLTEANVTKSEIDQVIVAGGSSSVTKIMNTLTQYFEGIEVKRDVFPEETAAAGAAIEASLLISDEDLYENDLTLEVDALPQSISISGADGTSIFMLKQGAPVPAKRTKTFTLGADQTKVQVNVYAGQSGKASENTLLAKLALKEASAGGDVDVTVSVDTKGEAKVSLLDKKTGKAVRAIIPTA